MECQQLVTIRACRRFEGGELDYKPMYRHDYPLRHADCGGLLSDEEDHYSCGHCGERVTSEEQVERKQCFGHNRVIR